MFINWTTRSDSNVINWYLNFSVNVFSAERDYVVQEDFMKAVRKLAENKKLEGKLDYEKV